MKKFFQSISVVFVFIVFVTAMPMRSPAGEGQGQRRSVCQTPGCVINCILESIGNREGRFSISMPRYMPEANEECIQLFYRALERDSGFRRWGFDTVKASRERNKDYITVNYQVHYRTTLEQDNAARAFAADLVSQWNLEGLTRAQKAGKLWDYIAANWSYDKSLTNFNAYSTFKDKKGVCLGLVAASQLLLDEMGVPSRTVNGMITKTKELHILLLVQLDDYWYAFDPTLAVEEGKGSDAALKNQYGKYFTPAALFQTEYFRKEYPMNLEELYPGCIEIAESEIPIYFIS